MKRLIIEVADERWARRLESCPPIERDEETCEPVAETLEEWAIMCAQADLDRGLQRREKKKDRHKPRRIGTSDVTITFEE
jgi:hypothetical protein